MKPANVFSRAYRQLINTYPTLSMAILTGTMMGFGSLISQLAVRPLDGRRQISYRSVIQFSSYGFFLAGPLMHHWFLLLNKLIPVQSNTRRRAIQMMLIDQIIMCPFAYSMFTLYNYWWHERDMSYVKAHFKQDVLAILIDNYRVWPLLQFVNFNVVPLRHRVLFINTAALFWNAYVAWLFRSKINSSFASTNKAINFSKVNKSIQNG
ncbi:hypothetical protein ACOME3_003536 [Neoechinorhynchus agilis]